MAINLVSQEQKNILRLEAIKERAWFGLIFLGVALIVFAFILYFFNFYLQRMVDRADLLAREQTKNIESLDFQKNKERILLVNQELLFTNNVLGQKVSIQGLLEKIAFLTPNSIYFNDLSLRKAMREIADSNSSEKEKQYYLIGNIKGMAQTREALYDFRELLAQTSGFENPLMEPFSWKEAKNAPFALGFNYFEK